MGVVFVLAFLRLEPGVAQGQEVKLPEVKLADTPAPARELATDQIIEAKIAEAQKETNLDQRFRIYKQIRLDIARAVEETKLKRTTNTVELETMLRERAVVSLSSAKEPGMSVGRYDAEIGNAERELADLKERAKTASSENANALRKDIASVESGINRLKADRDDAKKQQDERAKREQSLADRETDRNRRIEQARQADGALSRILTNLTVSQNIVDDELNSALRIDRERNIFKTQIALAFTGLVGMVILGFFVIAGVDVRVRQSIFSSQSGIQFITLFSVVIAIILFGITGILESKELSALLGGLSGYILGRAMTGGQVTPPPAPAPVST